MRPEPWPYPGARWWKFDFHTHTPASRDTPWFKSGSAALTPQDWLLRHMAAGIDCVAVTDHNSGLWVDLLKAAYEQMKGDALAGNPQPGFREITIFPGVEISVHGGVHILAILDPGATTGDIDSLLGRVDFSGIKGDTDEETRCGVAEVIQQVLDSGGIPIPAHADDAKGLLQVKPGTREPVQSAAVVRQAVAIRGLMAVEWLDTSRPLPECAKHAGGRLARVLGTDCHSFQGAKVPGTRYTWVKMATPTIQGLRMALLDGDQVSIRRSDGPPFDPFELPTFFITSLEVFKARVMGNDSAERLEFSPYYNALIGGRGTGKSTFVHAARLALHRGHEFDRLTEGSEARIPFDRFCRVAKSRDAEGGLREGTEIRIEVLRDGQRHRMTWQQSSRQPLVEDQAESGDWIESASQSINQARFPVRIFGQGQIAAIAGDSRQALLDVIDAAANVDSLHRELEERKGTWLAQRARLREINTRLAARPETERRLAEVARKLDTLTKTEHQGILKDQESAKRQRDLVASTRTEMLAAAEQVGALAARLEPSSRFEPDPFPPDGLDSEMRRWRQDANGHLMALLRDLGEAKGRVEERVLELYADPRLMAWSERVDARDRKYTALQEELAAQGIADAQAFDRLLQERQLLEEELGRLNRLAVEHDELVGHHEAEWRNLVETRISVSRAREVAVTETLRGNSFVRIKVRPFGADPQLVERSLREVLDVPDDRFENDILHVQNGEPVGGLAVAIAGASDAKEVEAHKQKLLSVDASFGGHFRNFLQRKLERPEFADHLKCWFPEDDLTIEYSRNGDGARWAAITQGSQGQRSAALLAFLLAFGSEPLILDQPEDDLDNHLIYDLIVQQLRENKLRRQLLVVTHNPNVVVNGDAELVHILDFRSGQCRCLESGALQVDTVRDHVCRVMEGGPTALARRWARLGEQG